MQTSLAFAQKSDRELWDLLRSSNKKAFSVLYQRHVKDLYNFGLRLTADREIIKDTLQELFTDFWTKRATLSEVKHVKVYLIKSLRYKLLRVIAKSKQTRLYSLDELLRDLSAPGSEEEAMVLERQLKLRAKLNDLPERQREVIHLRYFQNLKHEEIAEILNVNYQSVSNLLYRALQKLKGMYISQK